MTNSFIEVNKKKETYISMFFSLIIVAVFLCTSTTFRQFLVDIYPIAI